EGSATEVATSLFLVGAPCRGGDVEKVRSADRIQLAQTTLNGHSATASEQLVGRAPVGVKNRGPSPGFTRWPLVPEDAEPQSRSARRLAGEPNIHACNGWSMPTDHRDGSRLPMPEPPFGGVHPERGLAATFNKWKEIHRGLRL